MDFDRLFYMSDAGTPRAFYALPEDPQLDAIAIAQGEQDPPSPCRFRRNCGKEPFDVVGSGDPALLLLSSPTLQVLRAGSFTGWKSFPIEIHGRKGEPINGYEGLVITGRCGPIDWSKGKQVRKPPPVPQGRGYDAWVGMYFDPDSWDGSDLFLPEGTTYKILAEPVKNAIEEAGITNVKFKRLTAFERSWRV